MGQELGDVDFILDEHHASEVVHDRLGHGEALLRVVEGEDAQHLVFGDGLFAAVDELVKRAAVCILHLNVQRAVLVVLVVQADDVWVVNKHAQQLGLVHGQLPVVWLHVVEMDLLENHERAVCLSAIQHSLSKGTLADNADALKQIVNVLVISPARDALSRGPAVPVIPICSTLRRHRAIDATITVVIVVISITLAIALITLTTLITFAFGFAAVCFGSTDSLAVGAVGAVGAVAYCTGTTIARVVAGAVGGGGAGTTWS